MNEQQRKDQQMFLNEARGRKGYGSVNLTDTVHGDGISITVETAARLTEANSRDRLDERHKKALQRVAALLEVGGLDD